MKVRTILYPNGAERRGHTLIKTHDLPDSAFPKSREEAEKRSLQAMRYWLGVDPTACSSSVVSVSGDEFAIEGGNWRVEWRKGGAVQRHMDEIDALSRGDNDAYWHTLSRNRSILGQPVSMDINARAIRA